VILNWLLIREKLNLLVLGPLVVIVLLAVPVLAERVTAARVASDTANAATTAGRVGQLVQQLQQVRLRAAAYLGSDAVAPNAIRLDWATATDLLAGLRESGQPGGSPALSAALDRVAAESGLADDVVARRIGAAEVVSRIGDLDEALVDALALARRDAGAPQDLRRLTALDALLRADEAASREGALLLTSVSASTGTADRSGLVGEARTFQAADTFRGQEFRQLADPASDRLLQLALTGPGARQLAQVRTELAGSPDRTASDAAVRAFAAVSSQNALRQIVETKIARDTAADASAAARTAKIAAVAVSLAGLLVIGGLIRLALAIGRSVSRPLRQLTAAAGRVADLSQEELLRVADEDSVQLVAPRLAAVSVGGSDEVGELADAFNRVQATAALLLERQVTSRRNVSAMFAGVGRRTGNLVGRQLAIIDRLERAEDDPDVLSVLYRLDHVSTRLRRNASSLVVLSGARDSGPESDPMRVSDLVRSALGSIEEYQRVGVTDLPEGRLMPGVLNDVALLMAELIENAVLFSPPRTTVEVQGELTGTSYRLRVVDHGIGMPADRLADENAKLRRRERLDLAPSDVLGLFVVGRLSRRHGIDVTLEPTPGNGLTAVVDLPTALLVDESRSRVGAEAPARPADPAPDVPDPATPAVQPGVEPTPVAGGLATAGATAEEAATQDPAPAASAPQLSRRRPGEHLSRLEGEERALAAVVPVLDPKQLRRSLNELETGFARAAQDAAEQPAPAPGPAAAGLVRRRPGQSLDSLEATQPEPATGLPATVEPDRVRSLVEGVELAVRQANDQAAGSHGRPPDPTPPAAPPTLLRRTPGRALTELEALSPGTAVANGAAPGTPDPDRVVGLLGEIEDGIDRARRHQHDPRPMRPRTTQDGADR
jgi:signal transduction histidine kinase